MRHTEYEYEFDKSHKFTNSPKIHKILRQRERAREALITQPWPPCLGPSSSARKCYPCQPSHVPQARFLKYASTTSFVITAVTASFVVTDVTKNFTVTVIVKTK